MDISIENRTKILTLRQFTNMSTREIARECAVNQSSVVRILAKHKNEGILTPSRKGNCGRKFKITTRERRYLIMKSKQNPRKSGGELKADPSQLKNSQ